MALSWFKFYGTDWLTDLKVQDLSALERVCFVSLMCLASLSDLPDKEIKDFTTERFLKLLQLDSVSVLEVDSAIKKLENLGMITRQKHSVIIPRFDNRQTKPLTGYERIKRFRDKKKRLTKAIKSDNGDNEGDNTRIDKNRIDKNIIKHPPTPVLPVLKKEEPFDFSVYLEKLFNNPDRKFKIIANYWKFKNLVKPSLLATQVQLKRELKAAKNLLGYTDEQIIATMEFIDNDPKRTYVWTLETVLKRIDNVINDRS